MSEYKIARKEVTKFRLRHHFTFWLDRHARNKLGEYIQSVRFTDPQAVRAIFRHVLTGKVFWTLRGTSPRSRLLYRVERDPAAAALRFPNLWRESALKKKKNAGGLYGTAFQPTILGVQRITVMLDDAAKEGLVYAMRFLNLNHADAARWLLTNAQIPEPLERKQ